jgi:filamentous hemagglutinin
MVAPKNFNLDERRLGKKLGTHSKDFGLNPANPADRARMIDMINEIGGNPERSIRGSFRGQGLGGTRGPVEFRLKGNDVVVTTPDGNFVTILKDGINNPSVIDTLKNVGD